MKRFQNRLAWVFVMCLALGAQGAAQTGPTKFEGLIADFTADLDGNGAWRVLGEFAVEVKGSSGKADFSTSLSMVRADNAVRSAHTHHVAITDGKVTPIAGGFRISGAAVITGNGNLAGFSGSQITVDVTGGSAVPQSNIRLTFFDGAVSHFGANPINGVVTRAN